MKKGILVILAVAAVIVAAVIGGGTAYVHTLQNSGTFLAKTKVNGVDVSGKTPEEAAELFTSRFLDRQVAVTEDGKEVLRLSLSQLGYAVDDEAVTKSLAGFMVSEKIDFDTVMSGLTHGNQFQLAVPCKSDEETFNKEVRVDALSAPRKENVNAKLLYHKEENICKIEPEVQGTELIDEDLQAWLKGEIDAVLQEEAQAAAQSGENTQSGSADSTDSAAAAASTAELPVSAQEKTAVDVKEVSMSDGETPPENTSDSGTETAHAANTAEILQEQEEQKENGDIVRTIPASLYIPPEKKADDEKLVKKCKLLNEFRNVTITYLFGSEKKELKFAEYMDWLRIKDGKVSVKEDKVRKYVRKLAEKYETRYLDRVFTTSYGGQVTFPATLNEYGYTILEDQEAAQLTQDILNKESVEREPVYQTLGAWGDPLFLKRNGTDDLAGTYVEVCISSQHLWYYIDGSLFIESDVVTGDATLGQDTQTGVFPLAFKESPSTLRGGTGKNKYVTKVQYWMPFYEGQGLHDAWWKTVFGGSEYMGNGSHGCVNLPPDVAAAIYNNIVPGTAIIIYN